MTDIEKAERERRVFSAFLIRAGWPNDSALIESRNSPEPDILYQHPVEGPIAFELTEICSEEVAQLIASESASFVRSSSPVQRILLNKLSKIYSTQYTLNLLCYTAVRTISPDDLILAEMNHVLKIFNCGFRQIWLFGDNLHLVKP